MTDVPFVLALRLEAEFDVAEGFTCNCAASHKSAPLEMRGPPAPIHLFKFKSDVGERMGYCRADGTFGPKPPRGDKSVMWRLSIKIRMDEGPVGKNYWHGHR